MSQQTTRQKARRDALSVAAKRRAALRERARRVEGLAVAVLGAVRQREAAVLDAERRAGEALHEMTVGEGLTLREAVEWCDGQISLREATRLRKLVKSGEPAAADAGEAGAGRQGGGVGAGTATG